jgi:hypothetical protein
MQKLHIGPLSNIINKINPKCSKDLNLKPEIIKLLEENISKKLFDICLSKDHFVDMTPKAQAKKQL